VHWLIDLGFATGQKAAKQKRASRRNAHCLATFGKCIERPNEIPLGFSPCQALPTEKTSGLDRILTLGNRAGAPERAAGRMQPPLRAVG